MHILVIVSEFPKVTETFAVANILHYLSEGNEVDLFHIKPFRTDEVVHAEAQPALDRAFTFPWISGPSASALLKAFVTRPLAMIGVLLTLVWSFRAEPRRLAASLALLPKTLAAGLFARNRGADHINAEFASHPATAAWIIYRIWGIPFSCSAHAHDIFVSQSLLAQKSLEARFVRTISQFNVDFLSRLPGFDRSKIRLVRCGVDIERFQAEAPSYNKTHETFEIAFVGSLERRKGCEILINALHDLSVEAPWHLTIVGGGPEGHKLRRLAAALPEGSVSFEGPQPSDVVLSAMRRAHLVVMPSLEGKGGRSEGIPVVTMEALALCRPLIASRLSGIPELVEDGVTGQLIEPGDVSGLRRALIWTIENYQQAVKLARKGRRRVEAKYNIRENAAALLDLIRENSR